MRRYFAVATLLCCVVSGCASASDMGADMSGDQETGGHGDAGRADGGAARQAAEDDGKRGDGQRSEKNRDDKQRKDKRERGHRRRDHQVRLNHVVGSVRQFTSPSRNIACLITKRGVRCDIDERDYRPPKAPSNCDQDYGSAFAVASGEPELACVGDSLLGAAVTLPYGSASTVGDFGCQSRREGMYCYNLVTGRGFMLAQAGYEFY